MNPLQTSFQKSRIFVQRLFLKGVHRWRNLGLTNKMILLVTVGLTGLLTIFGTLGVWTSRQALQQTLNDRVWLARQSALTVDNQLIHLFELLEIAAGQVDLGKIASAPQDWDRLQAQFNRIASTDFPSPTSDGSMLFLIGADGDEIHSNSAGLSPTAEEGPHIDWRGIPAIQDALAGKARNISVLDETQTLIILAVPLRAADGGGLEGCLVAALDPYHLFNLPADTTIDSNLQKDQHTLPQDTLGFMEVIDGHGTILYSTAGPSPEIKRPVIPETLLKQLFIEGQPGVETCLGCEDMGLYFPIRGDLWAALANSEPENPAAQVIAFAPLSQAPWGVIIRQSTDVLFKPVRRLAITSLALGAIAILGALVLVRVTTGSVIHPVQQLTELSQRIAASSNSSTSDLLAELNCFPDCSAFVVADQRGDEIGALARSFSQMCQRLRQSLQENQEWLRQLDIRVQARTKELSILNAITQTVNQSLDLNFILERSLEEVLRLTSVDVGAIYLQEEQGNLHLMAHRGLSEEAARMAAQVGMLDGDCGGVVQHGRVVVVPDLSRYRGRRARSLQAERMTTLIHVPLIAHGAPLGSMCIGTRQLRQFENDEQSLLVAIGNQIAVAVENARLYQEVQQKEKLLSELLRKALAAQEDERKRIARELHDEVSQSITALMFAAEAGLETHPPALLAQQLQNIYALAQRTLDNIHQLIFDLRPSILDHLGLIPAIRWLTSTRLEQNGIRVSIDTEAVEVTGTTGVPLEKIRLPSEIEVALYRIVQEAINNILRHSGARNVTLQFRLQRAFTASTEEDHRLHLSIEDDGIGFNLSELEAMNPLLRSPDEASFVPGYSHRGWGILGMRERVELLGGEFHISSTPGEGTVIDLFVPLPEGKLDIAVPLESPAPQEVNTTQKGNGKQFPAAAPATLSAVQRKQRK